MKKLIDVLRKVLNPFLKKLIKPLIRTYGIRSLLRNILKPFILSMQGNRGKLKRNISSLNFDQLSFYGVTFQKSIIKHSPFPNNIEDEINNIIDLYKTHEEVLNYKNGNPFKNGEVLKKSFYFIRGKEGIHFNKGNSNLQKKYDGIDVGLIDIYNPQIPLSNDHWISKIIDEGKNIISKNIDFESHNIRFTHSNLYIYKNVFKPRCLHVDSYKKQFKCFIPLTISNSKERGCYAFVPFSHRLPLNGLQIFGRLLNFLISNSDIGYIPSGDGNLFHLDTALPLLVEPRDLIITCQKGIHGDIPSKNPIDRYVLVLNYLEGEWNF